MKTLDDNTVYRLDHNGDITVAVAENFEQGLRVRDTNKIYYLSETTERSQTETGLRFEVGEGSYFDFSPLTLEDAHQIYPYTIRTFKDLTILERFARRDIAMADSYAENTAPEEVVSFTVDEQDNVLDLIKVEDNGDLFHWVGEDWVKVGEDEDIPTIFDQIVIDVEREDIGSALELWKDSLLNGTPLTKEDILTLAALDQ